MKGVMTAWGEKESFGLRLEFRQSAWGANRSLTYEPGELVNRLMDVGAIVSFWSSV